MFAVCHAGGRRPKGPDITPCLTRGQHATARLYLLMSALSPHSPCCTVATRACRDLVAMLVRPPPRSTLQRRMAAVQKVLGHRLVAMLP